MRHRGRSWLCFPIEWHAFGNTCSDQHAYVRECRRLRSRAGHTCECNFINAAVFRGLWGRTESAISVPLARSHRLTPTSAFGRECLPSTDPGGRRFESA